MELGIQNLELHFAGLVVLRDVELSCRQDEVMALIGPNGAGKTALLNCISGVYRPGPKSRITLGGERIDHLPSHRIAAKGVARTFQHAELLDTLTVLDNVLLGLSPYVQSQLLSHVFLPWRALREDRIMRKRAMAVLERCGIAGIAGEKVQGMPLGIRRRLDLARALVSEPSLLLLDEPASGLSHEERTLIPELIDISRQEKNMGVVWIEHDLELVIAAADRVTVMHHGSVIQVGHPKRSAAERQSIIDAYMKGATSTRHELNS